VSGPSSVVVLPDPERVAAAAAARLVTVLVDAQAARGHAHAVLTGGTSGTALLAALAESPARDAVDWARVDLWWGDERFRPAGDPDRNETQAREVLLDRLPALDPARVHAMAPSDGPYGDDVDAAAAGYAAELAAAAGSGAEPAAAGPGSGVPLFDVLLLGVGPDGHVASLFPGHPGFAVREGTVIAVRESPKPPPTRISLTLPALQSARQTWLLAGGEGKADVVARAVAGEALPAGSVHGTEATYWLLDAAAAGGL
jgi:6-phosphogluconolactonase